jgi:Tol biopolymer transport system component
LLNVTTGELTSLFTLNLNVALLQWTPDGTKLIFEANRSGFGTNTSVMAYDLNTAQLVTLAEEGSAPSVSPDGRTIAFSAKHTDDIETAASSAFILNAAFVLQSSFVARWLRRANRLK